MYSSPHDCQRFAGEDLLGPGADAPPGPRQKIPWHAPGHAGHPWMGPTHARIPGPQEPGASLAPGHEPPTLGGAHDRDEGRAKTRTRAGRFPDDCRTEGRSSPEPRQGPAQGRTPGLVPVQPPAPDSPFWEEALYAHPTGWAPIASTHGPEYGLISAPPGALRGNWRIRSAHPCSPSDLITFATVHPGIPLPIRQCPLIRNDGHCVVRSFI